MQVFLIRHAEADDTCALAEPHRPLTPLGRRQARSLGDRLRWHDCAPTHIWTSPYIAAVQTAELLASRLDHDITVAVVEALAPTALEPAMVASPAPASPPFGQSAITNALVALPPEAIVYLVSHAPLLSALARSITGKDVFPANDASINGSVRPLIEPAEAIRIIDGVIRWRFAWDDEAADTTPDML